MGCVRRRTVWEGLLASLSHLLTRVGKDCNLRSPWKVLLWEYWGREQIKRAAVTPEENERRSGAVTLAVWMDSVFV